MRLTSASNSSIVIGVLEGLRTCWILCIAHVLVAPPFMYDRMNSIWLILLGNSEPHWCIYALHSSLPIPTLGECTKCSQLQHTLLKLEPSIGSHSGSYG